MQMNVLALTVLAALLGAPALAQDVPVRDMGDRLEPLVDRFLIDTMDGVSHRLAMPQPAETVLTLDQPWEGPFSGYMTILHDGDQYMLYYRGRPRHGRDGDPVESTCVALSDDGIHFTRPNLGLYEVQGTTENNVVLGNAAPFNHNFAPFLDTRPGVPADERFKALAGTHSSGLVAFASADGLHWRKLREEPVITEGAFDSQNIAFWSEHEGRYCCYLRVFSDGFRSIARCTSDDFLNWTTPVEMGYGGTPREHLYINQTRPYYRAPHLYVATAARFMPGRGVVSKEAMEALGGIAQYSGDCSDAVLLTSRGGEHYDRTFMEGFLRPGIGPENWTSRTNYPVQGIVPVGDSEMAFYVNRNYGQDSAYVQRVKLRVDGFASVHAPYAGGTMTTLPLRFDGGELTVNFSTSAAGGLRVEVLDEAGAPLPGYALDDADELVGDEIARVVTWRDSADVSALAGKPARLRFHMKDADLYAIRFR